MKKHLLFFCLLFLGTSIAFSQVIVGPLKSDPQRAVNSQSTKTLRITADTIQSLPFFDDFASYRGQPSTDKWEPNGGTYINNSYGINPPSYNVATFDGLNAEGHSYNQIDPYAEGNADILTSLPINLKKYSPADSLYLSYYWQAGGLGELPNPEEGDYLRLEFKDSLSKWNTIWEVKEDSTPFIQTLIPVKDKKYFFEGFQFRFRNYGNIAGSYDVWNLDYILLSDNRTSTDTNNVDLAIISTPGSFLKRYSAIPYKQFYPHWENEVKDSLEFRVRNHSISSIPLLMNNTSDSVNLITEEYTNQVIDSFSIYTFAEAKMDTVVKWKLPYEKIVSLNEPVNIKYHITPYVTDSVLFTANNQVLDSTVIANYFAYDDRSAEAVFSHNDDAGAMAVKYQVNHPDSVIGVDINFIPYGNNLLDKRIEIAVWESMDLGQSTASLLDSKEVRISYPKNNGFTRYFFNKPVAVTDEFYIGFIQYINDHLAVGLDLNTENSDKIYYKFRAAWYEYRATEDIPGSLMIRPILGGSHYVPITGNKNPEKTDPTVFTAEIYPNPTTGNIKIKGNVEQAIVYDLSGLVIHEKSFNLGNQDKELNISNYKAGIYLIRLQGKDGFLIKKVVLVN